MRLLSKVALGVAMTVVLGLGVLVLAARSASSVQEPEGDPIILKGGSLTIQCQRNDKCLPFNSSTKKHEHKDKLKKIQRIIVKDESGNVLYNGSKVNFPNGKPTIEVFYK